MKSKLRIVEGGKPASIFDNLEALRIPPDEKDPVEAVEAPHRKREPAKRSRLSRSKEEFARVPWHWLKIPAQEGGFPAWVRLYLCLWYRTHEGAKPMPLTTALAAEAGIDPLNKLRELCRLEVRGLACVLRNGNKVPVVTALRYPKKPT